MLIESLAIAYYIIFALTLLILGEVWEPGGNVKAWRLAVVMAALPVLLVVFAVSIFDDAVHRFLDYCADKASKRT